MLRYAPRAGSGDINGYGIRDREHSVAKPAGVYRIVVVGDSIAFGYCNDSEDVPIDRVFPHLLEERLNRDGGGRYEVVNLAVSGDDSRQESGPLPALRARAHALAPDPWLDASQAGFGNGEVSTRRARSPTRRPDGGGVRAVEAARRRPDFDVLVVVFPLFRDFSRYSHGRFTARHDHVRAQSARYGFRHLDLFEPFREAVGADSATSWRRSTSRTISGRDPRGSGGGPSAHEEVMAEPDGEHESEGALAGQE